MAKEVPDMNQKAEKERAKALELALAQIEKTHGEGTVMRFNDRVERDVSAIPTGSLSLDHALGVWGIPRGRITEIYGAESSGKTTIALHAVANAQRQGGVAAYIDAEHAMDPVYTRNLGVNLDTLLISQPDHGEQALDIVETLARSNAVDIVVVDSVAALVPKAELEGEMGDSFVGLQARLMSQAMRKLTGAVQRSNCSLVFINQIREKIGVVFGNPETTTGGRALKFYASVRIEVRRTGAIKAGTDNVGNRVAAKVVKNKLAPPFRTAEFDIMFGKGISSTGDVVDLAVKHKLIDKAGAWFSYEGTRLGQGREACKECLAQNPDLLMTIETRLKALMKPEEGLEPMSAAGIADDDELDDVAMEEAADDEPVAPTGKRNGSGRR